MPTVLIIDPNQTFRSSIRAAMEQRGSQVLEAACATSAIEFLKDSQPLVVILNASMKLDDTRLLDLIFTDETLTWKHAYILLTPRKNHPTWYQAIVVRKKLAQYSVKVGETRLLSLMVDRAATLLP